MSEEFDPYRSWLGISESSRPLSHYQLLGLPEFESNLLAIGVAADAMIARLKNCDCSDRRGRWQQLLDELTLAKLCLTDRTRRVQYDAQLRTRRGLAGPEALAVQPATPEVAQPTAAAITQPVAAAGEGYRAADLLPPGATPQGPAPMAQPLSAPQSVVQPVTQAAPVAQAAPMNPGVAAPTLAPPIQRGVDYRPPIAAPVAQPAMFAMPPVAAPVQPISLQSVVGQPVTVQPVMVAPVMPAYPLGSGPLEGDVGMMGTADVTVEQELFEPETQFETQEFMSAGGEAAGVEEPADSAVPAAPTPLNLGLSADVSRTRRQTSWSPDARSMGAFGVVAVVVLLGFVFLQGRQPVEVADADSGRSVSVNRKPAPVAERAKPKGPFTPPRQLDGPVVATPSAGEKEVAPANAAREAALEKEPAAAKPSGAPSATTPSATKPSAMQPEMAEALAQVDDAAPPAAEEPSPEKKAAFEKAIREARGALSARDLPGAREALKTAQANIGSKEQEDLFLRVEALTGYVEGFWKAVVEGLKGLQATDVIPIDNTEVAVVEVDDSSITIRAAGRNLSYTLQDMPAGLALNLANRWFDTKVAANLIYLGAFHAVDPRGSITEARRLWTAATQAGASAETLMPLLDDRPGPSGGEPGEVPARAAVAQGKKALRTAMAEQFKLARSLDRKLTLARELLDAAVENTEPVERYVLYDTALELAIEAGNAEEILRAVDGLATGYKVAAWDVRTRAFVEAARAANNPVVAKALAREMLPVIDQAIADDQKDHAGRLCTAAISVARKGKDLEVVRLVTERKEQLSTP